MTELKPPAEHAHLQYHWLRDMRLTASDGLPFLEPMLWHNDLWWRIGGSNPLNGHHHWRYHGPCDPAAIAVDARNKSQLSAVCNAIINNEWCDGASFTERCEARNRQAEAVLTALAKLGAGT
jgi:hypothetical protein